MVPNHLPQHRPNHLLQHFGGGCFGFMINLPRPLQTCLLLSRKGMERDGSHFTKACCMVEWGSYEIVYNYIGCQRPRRSFNCVLESLLLHSATSKSCVSSAPSSRSKSRRERSGAGADVAPCSRAATQAPRAGSLHISC